MLMPQSRTVRVTIRMPLEIDDFVTQSCQRIITANGKTITFSKTKSEVYIDFIKKGIMSLDEDDGS